MKSGFKPSILKASVRFIAFCSIRYSPLMVKSPVTSVLALTKIFHRENTIPEMAFDSREVSGLPLCLEKVCCFNYKYLLRADPRALLDKFY
jgi:hypothetical protein